MRAVAFVVAGSMGACSVGDVAPLARYPWVEHARVALDEETLSLDVGDGTIEVEATFSFAGEGDLPLQLDFPVGRGGDVLRFEALLRADDGAIVELPTRETAMPPIPTGEARETRALQIPEHTFASKNRLIVRYRQRSAPTFGYVLKSGAYWSGAIHALFVRVRDARGVIASAEVEGRGADARAGDEQRWSFVDVEPHGGVVLQLK